MSARPEETSLVSKLATKEWLWGGMCLFGGVACTRPRLGGNSELRASNVKMTSARKPPDKETLEVESEDEERDCLTFSAIPLGAVDYCSAISENLVLESYS